MGFPEDLTRLCFIFLAGRSLEQCCLPSPAQFSTIQTNSSHPETHKARVWASQSCVLPLFFTFFLSFLPSILYNNKKLRLYHSNIRAPSSWLLNARSKQPTSPPPQLIKMNDTKNPALWDMSRKVHSKEAILACSLSSVVVQEHHILFWLS